MANIVTVLEATVEYKEVFCNLLQFYLYELSQFVGIESLSLDVDETGIFRYPEEMLAGYWTSLGRIPLLIRVYGRVAGFALLSQQTVKDRPVDHAVAEFFILRKYRRAGIGTAAAKAIFGQHPGEWEVAVADYNRKALRFWRRALRAAAATEISECAGDGRRWSGTVLRFRAAQQRTP